MNVVFLDAKTLPVPLHQPDWAQGWTLHETTRPEQVVERLAGAQIAITNKVALREAELAQLPDLKLIAVAATGYDVIDLDACRARGVRVCNVPGYSAQSVAEWVIASLFVLRRRLFEAAQQARQDWADSPIYCVHTPGTGNVAGMTLGVLGQGAIGGRVAALAQALGVEVLQSERPGSTHVRAGYTPFEEVLARADALTLHCPLTPDTRACLNADAFARMKPGALLINAARGALIDEGALRASLANGHLGGAALDVLSQEPPAADHQLLTLVHPNLIITAHSSWAAPSGTQGLARGIEANLDAFHAGRPQNVVA